MPEKPSIGQLREIAHMYGMHLNDADLKSFRGLMGAIFESYRRIDQLSEPALPVRYARTGGYRPAAEENPLNAWYQQCSIKGAASGSLAGKRIAIKDNVCVAGVPMMNGSSVLEGYVPEFDATIVTRILDAGGEIVGKAVCESLCFSHTAFPTISPPASRMRVTMVASNSGTYPSSTEDPFIIGTPATQTLSLIAIRFPAREPLAAPLMEHC